MRDPDSLTLAGNRRRHTLIKPVGSLFACAVFAFGCSYQLAPDEKYQNFELLPLEEESLSPPRMLDTIEIEPEPRISPPVPAPATLPLAIADARQSALENNLDLQVDLILPTLAEQSISEQEARFEATFFGTTSLQQSKPSGIPEGTGTENIARGGEVGVQRLMETGADANVRFGVTGNDPKLLGVDPSYDGALTFSISQPLLRDAGIRFNQAPITIARLQKQQTDTQTTLSAIRVLAEAERAYWRYYGALRELEIRYQQYERALDQEHQAKRLAEFAVIPEIEVMRSRVGISQRIEAIIVTDTGRRLAQRNLKRVINRPDAGIDSLTALLLVSEPQPVQLELMPKTLADRAVANRMEMLELEVQLAIDAVNIDIAENQRLPIFSLDYNYSFLGSESRPSSAIDTVFSYDFSDWTVGANVQIPIGNQAARARLRQAILQRGASLATRDQRALRIRQEVYDALDQLQQNWQRIIAARQGTLFSAKTYEAEKRLFQVGLRTSTEVLEAENFLGEAQIREIRALVEYEIAKVDIAFATGTLLGYGRVRIESTPYDEVTNKYRADAETEYPEKDQNQSQHEQSLQQRQLQLHERVAALGIGDPYSTPKDIAPVDSGKQPVPAEPKPADSASSGAGADENATANSIDALDPAQYTLQLAAHAEEQGAQSFIEKHRQLDDKLVYFRSEHDGQTWYPVVYGSFPSASAARAAADQLPDDLRARNPWVRNIGAIQRAAVPADKTQDPELARGVAIPATE